jgi:hypothetical protein
VTCHLGSLQITLRFCGLGTPFGGFSKENISTTQIKNIKDVEEGSEQLGSINDAFQKYPKVRDRSVSWMEVACFFERYALYPRGKKTFVVLEESASLPGIDAQPIQANHETMCQFEDEDREGYKSISQSCLCGSRILLTED